MDQGIPAVTPNFVDKLVEFVADIEPWAVRLCFPLLVPTFVAVCSEFLVLSIKHENGWTIEKIFLYKKQSDNFFMQKMERLFVYI